MTDHEPPAFKFYRSLPRAANVDIWAIKGNLSPEHKQLNANIFEWFVTGGGSVNFPATSGHTVSGSYQAGIGRRMQLVEMDVWIKDGAKTGTGRSVCEILVEKDMCNVCGTLHGACVAFLIDAFCGPPLVSLGLVLGIDASGPSNTMDLLWHKPVYLGTTLRLVGTTMAVGGKLMTVRCEVWDKDTEELLVSAVQTRVNTGLSKPKQKSKSQGRSERAKL